MMQNKDKCKRNEWKMIKRKNILIKGVKKKEKKMQEIHVKLFV